MGNMLTVNRIIMFFIFTAIFAAVYGSSAILSEPTEAEVQEIMDFFDSIVDTIDGIGIFAHNTTIAIPMFIPGFGVAWGLFSAYSTGFAFSAIATANPDIAQVNPLNYSLNPIWSNGGWSIFNCHVTKCIVSKEYNSKKLGSHQK